MELCRLDALRERATLSFSIAGESGELEGFVVMQGEWVYAYLNRCPHSGAPLNWSPDVFLSPEGTHIQCSLHGALFQIDDGLCVFGPCSGESLMPLPVAVEQGAVVLLEQGVPLPP